MQGRPSGSGGLSHPPASATAATAARRHPAVSSVGAKKRRGPRLRNRQSIVLIAIIIVALVAGGLAGAELYARHRAGSILVEVAECVVQDGVTISFGVNPPFLWQHITGHYTNISVVHRG